MQKYLTFLTSAWGALFYHKNLYYVFLLCLCWAGFHTQSLFPAPLPPAPTGFNRNYSSDTGSLGRHSVPKPRLYNFYQLLNLRKALSPRYIRVFDQRQYLLTGKIMRRGILFTYKASSALVKRVSLAGNFNNWSGIVMKRNRMGVFFHVLPLEANSEQGQDVYRYKFIVDGVWQHDPNNPYQFGDQMGGYYSLFYVDERPVNRLGSVRVYKTGEKSGSYWVEFSAYLPKVRRLTLVGNFNNWNPEHDPMPRDERGFFRKKIKLEPGEYIYKFIADGKWVLDKYNSETRFDPTIQELASFLSVP